VTEPNARDDLLRDYLAERDEPCPVCGYSLRGLTGPSCPECGASLRLAIAPQRAGDKAWLMGLIAISAALGFAGSWVYTFLCLGWDLFEPEYVSPKVGLLLSVVALIAWIAARRWHERRGPVVRWLLGSACSLLPLASVILFVWETQ